MTNNGVTASGLPEGFYVTATASGSQTDAGSSANVVNDWYEIMDADGKDQTASFTNVKKVDGTLTITPINVTVTITGHTSTVAYDGKEHEVTGYEVQSSNPLYTEADFAFSGTNRVAGTYVGTYNMGLQDNQFTNTNKNFETVTFNVTDGLLTITGDEIIPGKTTPVVASNYALGDKIPFTITVTNTSKDTATNVTVVDDNAEIVAGTGYSVSGNVATIASIEPGQTVTVHAQHEVTVDDILEATVNNTANIAVNGKTYDATAETTQIEPKKSHLTVVKTTTTTPQHDGAYWPGETIAYSITVTNDGNVPIENVTVTDQRDGFVFDEGKPTTAESLAPGDSFTATGTYTVTEADAIEGTVVNSAIATGTDPTGGDGPGVTPGTTEDTVNKNSHVTVTKTTTSTPANGTAYALGETIRYSITVTNDGNMTLTEVNVQDTLEGSGFVYDQGTTTAMSPMNPGDHFTATGSYVVTEADVIRGNVVNNATVTATDPEGVTPTIIPGTDEEPVEPKNSHLTVTKEITSTAPADGYGLGDTITYRITVLNDGNVELHDVSIVDQLEGFAFDASAVTSGITLAPGQSASATGSYVVTEADVIAGRVLNRATAEGTDPEEEPAEPVPGETEVPVINRAYTLTIQYVYSNGTVAAESYTQQVQYNAAYSVTSPVIPGYTASQTVVSGTMPARNQTVTVIYVNAVPSYNDGPSADNQGPSNTVPDGNPQPVAPDNNQNNNQNNNANNPAQNNQNPLTIINEYGTPLGLGNVALGAGEFIE